MSQDPPKKRAGHRFLTGVTALLTLGNDKFDCQAVDLSRVGVMIEGTFDLNDRSHATIELKSTAGDLVFETRCRVARVSLDPTNGRTQLGLEFGSVDADLNQTLELLISRVVEGMSPAALAHLTRTSSVQEIHEALDKVPLAHKIILAQKALPLERSFLRHDDDSQVTEALCRNPKLTLPEVIQILRMPTLLPTTLDLLSRDPRWTPNEEVKITIATHPRVTFPVAERLVATLGLPAIRKIIRRPGLHPAIKAKLVQNIPNKQLQSW